MIKSELLANTEEHWKEAVEKEMKIMQKLPIHPNIIRFIEAIDERDDIIFVIPFEGGRDTKKLIYLSERQFSENEIKLVNKQVLLGVQALHRAGIYHLDTIPDNLIMEEDTKKVKIIDYNCAVLENKRLYADLPFCHVPPEFHMNDGLGLPSKIDSWLIGVTTFQLLFKRLPFGCYTYESYADIGSEDDQLPFRRRLVPLDYYFDREESPEFKDFIARIFTYEDQRATIDELLIHPWVKNVIPPK